MKFVDYTPLLTIRPFITDLTVNQLAKVEMTRYQSFLLPS